MAIARLKLVAPEPTEEEIHETVARGLDRLLKPPAFWCCYPAGTYWLSKPAAARLSRNGLKPGIPDILIFYYGVYGIELKTKDGKLTRTRIVHSVRSGRPRAIMGQVEAHALLRQAGANIAVCRSLDEVLAQLRAWGIPTWEAAA
jgi:hypothetical protein